MELTWQMYAIVCPLVFLAGFVDSVAGGGGLISLPAYYMAGLPPVLAAGTNKLSACLGTIASSAEYVKEKKVDFSVAILAMAGAFPGSYIGTRVLETIDENTIRKMMLVVIPLVAVVVLRKGGEMKSRISIPKRFVWLVSLVIGLVVGFYDGLVGPGTGTFIILFFTLILGMDTITASGSAKLVNLASNIASLVTLLFAGKVLILLGLPAAACAICGNLIGANMTVHKGGKFIHKMLLVVLALLMIKMLIDVIK